MRTIPFEKMHGLGNHFVVVRADRLQPGEFPGELVRWCDPNRGIGADGVLVLSRESERGFTMRVVNRDGSIPETCGNGIRCAVRSWARQRGVAEGLVEVTTDAGLQQCVLRADGLVTVDMGPARLDDTALPLRPAGRLGPARLLVDVGGDRAEGLAISMGNPHLVLFGGFAAIGEAEAAPLERHPAFPQRVNVSFAGEPAGGHIHLRVFERGVGFTQACGSGACATVVAAALTGRVPFDQAVVVDLPGGSLTISVSPDLARVPMTGPAELVFRGELEVSGLAAGS